MAGAAPWSTFAAVAMAVMVSGCMQTTSNLANSPQPAAANPAEAAIDPSDAAKPAEATALQPTGQPAPAQAAAAPEPESEAVVRRATPTQQGYPNINVVPDSPGGAVLPDDERKRIIEELEAMRAGQGKPPRDNGKPAALNETAATHGERALEQIEKCSQEGATEQFPECAQ